MFECFEKWEFDGNHDLILILFYFEKKNQEPLWLNMSTFPQRKSDYAASLIKEFIYLIDEYDNESHSYIISTLLTAVLMYHLSWVQTVAPPDEVRVRFIL